ncbi:GIY-YIG nuclease family protein [Microbacterium sp. 69-10]
MPHVYILKCSDGSFYTGSTWSLELRVAQHGSSPRTWCSGR